ncbi:hypothetical protein Zmor_016292 [Zophobas morio]|uniref:PTS lactose/cellobiose transporter subunit IIA n=1 Tax=Zophobas morio TaxID=2755281 RepID=A0AA38HG05_9CUCU|nr:hypothetical protein Zmor_016292 [Zophobas morio]
MQIIANVGIAKSNAVIAMSEARKYDFDKAKTLIKEAHKAMIVAENAHMEIVVQEAQGVQHEFKVLFMHAEDQMLTCQTLMIVAEEMIAMYKKMKILEEK